jgi:hypothetical protein
VDELVGHRVGVAIACGVLRGRLEVLFRTPVAQLRGAKVVN